jgi:predicted phosphodiesterase
MFVAALYDIHGNLPALEAVLDVVRQARVDLIVVGGDVLPGPMPSETLACLRDLEIPARYIRGNGDREVLAQRAGIESNVIPPAFRELMRWSAEQLSDEDAQWIESWPPVVRFPIDDLGDVLWCHATPRNDVDVFTRLTPDAALLALFEETRADLVVCGHTHMQFDRTIGATRVVNAGSVGMPFGAPGAYWLLLERGVRLQTTAYDLESAADRIRWSGYPHAEAFATSNVLQPPSEDEMLARLGAAELR